jgi:hypothetical protein
VEQNSRFLVAFGSVFCLLPWFEIIVPKWNIMALLIIIFLVLGMLILKVNV